ncbi:outer membrane protein [Bradyrhizobium ganzhouense]|uniref:outer membrane protein n=1 Tax=Bradyrhizobium ganzhouense TaxID=1179767 RepID=UPI003CEB2F67
MKKILFASASLLALSAFAPAMAADLAARPYTKAPVAIASIYNWSGFYIGANAGGGSSHNCWDTTAVGGGAVPVTAEGCHNATGAIAGGQIGYRWQSTNWVFGVEAQGDWADLKGSNTSSLAAFFPLVNNTKIDALGLFTGQVGYAWNNVLWYVKGGAAVTHNKFSGTLAGITFGSASETRWGGAVGTGIEFGFAPNWSVGVEYNHLFMGKHTDSFTAFALPFRSDSIKQDVDMATVRLNYTFGGPIVAKY